MSNTGRDLREGESASGSVSTVTRFGTRIRRPVGPWTPAVHALLQHLSTKDYLHSPRVRESTQEFEELDYLEGAVALRPWPPCLLKDSGLIAIGEALNAYHHAVADFIPPPNAVWRDPDRRWSTGQIIRHGDLGPWNMVWREDQLVGFIDWDMVEPGDALEDIAQIAWHSVPLRTPELCQHCGVVPGKEQVHRFSLLCEVCHVSRMDALEVLREFQHREIERTLHLAAGGIEPWVGFHLRGDVASIDSDVKWLAEFSAGQHI
jgi:hypothetical protein